MIVFSNFGRSKLAAGIPAATTAPFTMSLADGTKFKAYGAGEYEYLVLKDASLNREIIKVTARTGGAFTVTQRAIGGTTARDWSIDDLCEAALTAQGFAGLLTDTVLTGNTSAENMTFPGTGGRIRADLSNATIANRLLFQSSTANGNSNVDVIPNGSATSSSFGALNSSDTVNTGFGVLSCGATAVALISGAIGTAVVQPIKLIVGAFTPVTYSIDGSETHTGNTTYSGNGLRILGDFSNGTQTNRLSFQTSTVNASTSIQAMPNGSATAAGWQVVNSSGDVTNTSLGSIQIDATTVRIYSTVRGTGTQLPLALAINTLDTAYFGILGQWGIGGANYGAAGTQAIVSGGPSAAPTWTTINKAFVGLGNVDNTSNATERTAVATLTNKTLTAPAIAAITTPGGTLAVTGAITASGDIVAFA
ncbi:MAG: hypothetical protein JWN23_1541 [Rhodocyclales bacterium]|nr:hypothetical protein [Rhodocyclales bacterium]